MLDEQLLRAEHDRPLDCGRDGVVDDRHGLARRRQRRRDELQAEALGGGVDDGARRAPVEHQRHRRAQRAAVAVRTGEHFERMALLRDHCRHMMLARCAGQGPRCHDDAVEVAAFAGEAIRRLDQPVARGVLGDPARGIAEFPSGLAHLSERVAVALREVTRIGDDLRIVARVTHRER